MSVSESIINVLVHGIYPHGTLLDQKLEYNVGNSLIYLGAYPRGAATSSPVWIIFKYVYDGSGNITDIKVAPANSIWDNRVSLFP